jgi:hypothetical protein
MATLPKGRAIGPQRAVGLLQVISLISALVEAFADAYRQATVAHKRYPFAEW